MPLNKRETIALSYWYERQPSARASIWNTRHSQQPVWLKRQFASYISWKYMGGPAKWWAKAATWVFFILTSAVYAWHCRKTPPKKKKVS